MPERIYIVLENYNIYIYINSSWHTVYNTQLLNDIMVEIGTKMQLTPEFANSIDECTDTSKVYVLPDGYIYAYMKGEQTTEIVEKYTNLLPIAIDTDGSVYNDGQGWKADTRLNSSGTETSYTDVECTGFIPVKFGDMIYFENIKMYIHSSATHASQQYFAIYDSDKNLLYMNNATYLYNNDGVVKKTESDYMGYYVVSIDTANCVNTTISSADWRNENMAYFRFSATEITDASIITVNEEIVSETVITTTHTWTNTGLVFSDSATFTPIMSQDGTLSWENNRGLSNPTPINLMGYSPVKGIDYWTDADQESIVQQVITALGTPVFGRVDEDNNIILTGELVYGTYTLKYEDSDGNLTDIGSIEIGEGDYTNQIPLSINSDGTEYVGTDGEDGYKVGYRLNSSGLEAEASGITVTGFIPAKYGDTVYIDNMRWIVGGDSSIYSLAYVAIYDNSFACIAAGQAFQTFLSNVTSTYTYDTDTNQLLSFTIDSSKKDLSNACYIRMSFVKRDSDEEPILTVNQPIV